MKKINAILIIVLLMTAGAVLDAQINTEKFRKEKDEDNFEMKIGVALSMYKGNTDILRLDSDLNIGFNKNKNYLFLVGNITYGEKNKAAYLNKGFAHLRWVRRLSQPLMMEVFVQEEFNEFILLKRRDVAGAGVRVRLVNHKKDTSKFVAHVGLGLVWENELYNESDTKKKEDAQLFKSTNYLSFHWDITDVLSMESVDYIQFNLGKGSSTRITSELKFNVKLSKALSFTTTAKYRYDSNPPQTVKNYDLQIKNGLTLKL